MAGAGLTMGGGGGTYNGWWGRDLQWVVGWDLQWVVGWDLQVDPPYFDRTHFQFSGLSDRVVAGAGEDIHVGIGEAEAGEDGSARGAGGGFDFEFDLAAAGGHFGEFAVDEAPGFGVVWVDFEGFLGEEVVDPTGTAGLGAGVVGLEAAAGGEPDGVVLVDDFGRVAVADDFEEAGFVVLEFLFVKDGGAGVAFFGDGPLVVAIADVVPVEAFVDGA